MKRKVVAGALALVMVCGILPAGAAAQVSSTPFTDISDPKVADAAELLRLLGIVNGTGGGRFNAGASLTRAEFCKMAVELMDNGDKVAGQMNRTIFRDVPSTHWARGYINLASQGSGAGDQAVPGIIRGDDTGAFRPEEAITCAEAVTILMRILGYTDTTVGFGSAWYDGYLSTAAAKGVTEGLSLSPEGPVTRGQAAILMENLLYTPKQGESDDYLETVLGCKTTDGGVVLDVDATADDGTPHAFKTTKGTYKTSRVFAAALAGQEGDVLLDKDDKLLAFLPEEGSSARSVNILTAEAAYMTVSGGDKFELESDTQVYQNGKATTWKDVYLNLSTPAAAAMHYGADGKLNYIYLPAASEDGPDVLVARSTPNGTTNPFSGMVSGGAYTMFKNGVEATAADIRKYDVATWDSATRVMQVSDLKLTGIYEDASPSTASPLTIQILGRSFSVLACAREDLAAFTPGDSITLLLTSAGEVAGVVSGETLRAQAVGIATVSNGQAQVKLLQGSGIGKDGLVVSGLVSTGTGDRCNNQLVTVTSNAKGRLSLQTVGGSKPQGSFDVTARRIGDKAIAPNATVYDRVENGAPVEVDYDQLPAVIPSEQVGFVSYDYAGRIQYIVLNDATGDAYTYGFFVFDTKSHLNGSESGAGDDSTLLWLRRPGDKGSETATEKAVYTGKMLRQNAPGGVALMPAVSGKDQRVAAVVELKSLEKVSRSAFDAEEMTVTVGGAAWPVSNRVVCYNKDVKTWFASGAEGVEAIRAYSDTLTLWYDRPVAEGGKIRMITVGE